MAKQQKAKQLKPTPISEWRKLREEGEIVELPSTGRVVRWRSVSLQAMLISGSILDVIASEAARVLWDEESDDRPTHKKVVDWNNLVAHVVAASLIEPKVIVPTAEIPYPELADDEILISDLTPDEQMSIYNLAVYPTQTVRRFRDEQAGDVEALPQGGEGGEATE